MDYKILDYKKGIVKIYITSKEDILDLVKVIEPGDFVKSRTYRVIKSEYGKKETIPVTITLQVEKVYLERENLKIIGKIVESSSDEVPLNKYHSFMFSQGDEFILIKQNISETFYSMLEYFSRKSKSKNYLLISIDDDSAAIAEVKFNNIKILREISGPGTIKNLEKDEIYKYFSEIIKIVENCLQNSILVFLLQPSIEHSFLDFIKSKHPEFLEKCYFFKVSHGGIPGIYEAIRAGYLKNIDKNIRITEEVKEIENLFLEIIKSGKVAYGLEEIKKALEYNAIEKLYVLESMLDSPEIKKIVEEASNQGVKIVFINPFHEGGRKLYYLGGIAAKLRFQID